MKRLILLLTLLLISFGYALPFQEPTNGIYQCFSSDTNAFDENAKDIGATLELNGTTYTLTVGTASEKGTLTTQELNDPNFDVLFQSGSGLSLQPESGSTPSVGAFVVDKQGSSYVITRNAQKVWIRCQSEGADIASIYKGVIVNEDGTISQAPAETSETQQGEITSDGTEEAAPSESETLPTAPSSETLTPLPSVQSGAYGCYHTYEVTFWASSDDPSYHEDDNPDIFGMFLYDDGTLLTFNENARYASQYEKGTYTFDAANSKLSLQGGNFGGLTLSYGTKSYGTNAAGLAALSYIETKREVGGTDKEWVNTYACERQDDLPAQFSLGIADSTPVVDLANVTVASSKFDVNNPDPSSQPMPDTYYCYPSFNALETGEGYPNYLREYQLELFPNNRYSFNGQEGEFRTKVDEYYFQWMSGPLNPTGDIVKGEDDVLVPHSSSVSYDVWGSEITNVGIPQEDGRELHVDCFQQGAREQKALLDFALQQPTPGSYSCLTSGDNPAQSSLELLPNNHYSYNAEEGSYRAVAEEYSTNVIWDSGPLGGDTTYSADDSTGVRTFLFSSTQYFSGGGIPTGSSTETTMACESVAPANLIPQYGSTPAAPPPAGSGGLEGFYVRTEYDLGDVIQGEPPTTTWYYYHFLPNGYVYENGYSLGDECTHTYPNGQAVCRTYTAQGSAITFSDSESVTMAQADGGITLNDQHYEEKRLEGPQTLNGVYAYAFASSSPMYMQLAGMGYSSISEESFTFNQDGSFSFSSSSSSTMSAPDSFGNAGDIGVLAQNGSSESDSGTYSIEGNVMTLTYDTGYSRQCAFFFGDNNDIVLCGQEYSPPSEE